MKKKTNTRDEGNDYNAYLLQLRMYSETQFDKLIIYLASGGLSFSIFIAKDKLNSIATNVLNCSWMLLVIWILFVLSIISMLISHMFTTKAVDKELTESDSKGMNSTVNYLNKISFITLILGIILLLIFYGINYVK